MIISAWSSIFFSEELQLKFLNAIFLQKKLKNNKLNIFSSKIYLRQWKAEINSWRL